MAIVHSQSKHLNGLPPGKAAVVTANGIKHVDRGDYVPEPEPEKPKKPRKPHQKNDPEFVAKARELRDKFLEQVNSGLLLPPSEAKYEVSRLIDSSRITAERALEELPEVSMP
jgi:hypothetical protein